MNKSQSFWGKRKTGYDLFLLHPFFANIFPLHLPLPLPLTDTLSPSSCSSLLFSSWGKIKPHPIASSPYPHLSPSFILHYLSFSSYLLSRVTSVTFYLGQYSIAKKDSLHSRFSIWCFHFYLPSSPSISTFHLFFHLLKFLSPSFSSLVVRVINIKWNAFKNETISIHIILLIAAL